MTTLKISREEFEKHIKLSDEIIEKISLFGTPLERIDENEIEVEIFPNRPDLLSVPLFIKSFSAFLGKGSGIRNYNFKKPEREFEVIVESSVQNVRPFTACAIVKRLPLNEQKIRQIIDLQEKLHLTLGRNRKKFAAGIYPLDKIKLPITYKAISPQEIKFIPLGYEKEMNAIQILKRHPVGKAYSNLLNGLEKFPVFIDAEKKILSMPPIINSNETGQVTEKTKEVFVECSGYDFNLLNKALCIIVTSLAEIGGEVYKMRINYKGRDFIIPDLSSEKMNLSLENVNKILGLKLKEPALGKLLARMGHEYENKKVHVPAWRTDLLHEIDLIEDIAIAYGYNNFEPEIPNITTTGEESKESIISKKLAEILIGLGFIEICSYHLIKKREAEIMKLTEEIEIENSKTDYKLLRPNLLIPALRILSENKDNEYPQNIFEIGTVFSTDKSGKIETGIEENENLAIVMSPSNLTNAKQMLDYFFRLADINFEVKKDSHSGFIEGRTAAVLLNGKKIGYIGEVHPEILGAWNIKMPVSAIEISLEEIFKILGH